MPNRLPFSEPSPSGSVRAREAKRQRDLATEISRLRPQALTKSNGEELEQGSTPVCPANFTKGLLHDGNGLLADPDHYRQFVEAINSPDITLFEKHVTTAADANVSFKCTVDGESPEWRGYESPRSGHVYELQGPDAGAVGMAPAPRLRSSEFVAEIAEVYSMAILRDVPFSAIESGGGTRITGGDAAIDANAELTSAEVVDALNTLPFFDENGARRSSTPARNFDGYNAFEANRLDARLQGGSLTTQTLFRGSTPGALAGPYISQFMVAGNTSRLGGVSGGSASYPARQANFDAEDGYVVYGNQIIDQRSVMHQIGVDHMTEWNHWLDVQNGANFGALPSNTWEVDRRFITTPRDLATYVHFDALYQAYLNAALMLLGAGTPFQRGFPEPSVSGRRTPFATFGGPHILSLVCEVATRCLKAVRRQKFNYHRRARPEATAALLSFAMGDRNGDLKAKFSLDDLFGEQAKGIREAEAELPDAIRDAVIEHNRKQNRSDIENLRAVKCTPDGRPQAFKNASGWRGSNLLLPMAFPEGSPMHPAYGAGHATVAGGCVTMLKAFFEMYTDCRGEEERILDLDGNATVWQPSADGTQLEVVPNTTLTIQGELDKLAANISIGRNMAGVHYYSDYYDSARMGERIAIGILMEQIPTYGEEVESTFKSFDGDLITITGTSASCPSITICDAQGNPVAPRDWWLRHVVGEEIIEDFGA
ncbi:MAG: bromoperoxidase [Pseudomonadota bacterium]